MGETLTGPVREMYKASLALLVDLYELTMAYGYWKAGLADRHATFHLTFRTNPFGGGFAVACGLGTLVDYLEQFRFSETDLEYLAGLEGNDGRAIFPAAFLEYLARLRFTCDLDAVPEGTVVFPHEPLVRVVGPLAVAQLLETAILNIINFQTLIATKAARVVLAADGDPVLEFGLRRAHGIDGGVSASRAAYVGGCAATSNTLAGRLFGIPVRGTLAHSWVMCFPDEPTAFRAYAEAMPNNCVLLVDTYDTLQGVKNAVEVGRWLRRRGHRLQGVRLDSGDLARLSIEARKILDQAGLADTVIVASNDLDEYLIAALKQQGAQVGVWGVGTRLVTAYDEPALGGVYKLSAICDQRGRWHDRVKVSEQAVKSSTPGILQVRRFFRAGEAVADAVYDTRHIPGGDWVIVDPVDATRRETVPAGTPAEDLLVPVFRQGQLVGPLPPLDRVRRRAQEQLAQFPCGIKRLVEPQPFPAGLEQGLFRRRNEAVVQVRGNCQ